MEIAIANPAHFTRGLYDKYFRSYRRSNVQKLTKKKKKKFFLGNELKRPAHFTRVRYDQNSQSYRTLKFAKKLTQIY